MNTNRNLKYYSCFIGAKTVETDCLQENNVRKIIIVKPLKVVF